MLPPGLPVGRQSIHKGKAVLQAGSQSGQVEWGVPSPAQGGQAPAAAIRQEVPQDAPLLARKPRCGRLSS